MKNLMIDLETLGTAFNAPVLAIGAVYFDPDTGALGERFYGSIDVADACRYGRPNGDTIRWWMGQSDEARKAAVGGKHPAAFVLEKFGEFALKHGLNVCPWGNGASFDISILDYAFPKILDKPAPWKFWNVRDCRTIKEVASKVPPFQAERAGTHHNALDDAIYQAQWVSYYWQALRGVAPKPVVAEAEALLG